MNNYHQEGFVTMQQYMEQFTGEEPAQIREHNRVAELEREVERLRAALAWYADDQNYWLATGFNDQLYSNVERDDGQRARKALNSE